MNEETVLNVNPAKGNEKKEQKEQKDLNVQGIQEVANKLKKKGRSWANVTLGGVSGILLGAGSAYGAHSYANGNAATDETNSANQQAAEDAQQTAEIPQATSVNDDQSFAEAFEAARAEVGTDGVFVWHNGTYTTMTSEEWNALTAQQQESVVEQSGVSTPGSEISQLPSDGHPDPVIDPIDDPTVLVDPVDPPFDGNGGAEPVEVVNGTDGGEGDDVHVVGISEEDGHTAAQVDLDGDGETDITIVDVDDNNVVSDPDLVYDNDGNSATIAEINAEGEEQGVEGGVDTYLTNNPEEEPGVDENNIDEGPDMTSIDNPEVADGMPDYMNDAMV